MNNKTEGLSPSVWPERGTEAWYDEVVFICENCKYFFFRLPANPACLSEYRCSKLNKRVTHETKLACWTSKDNQSKEEALKEDVYNG